MKDLTGKTFGQWFVITEASRDRHNKRKWLCKCSCGSTYEVGMRDLTSGKSTKCKNCKNVKTEGIKNVYTKA